MQDWGTRVQRGGDRIGNLDVSNNLDVLCFRHEVSIARVQSRGIFCLMISDDVDLVLFDKNYSCRLESC